MVIFIEFVQYTKNLGGKSWKNLVEHPIIKNDKKKLNSIICRFFAPHIYIYIVKITHSVCYKGPCRLTIPKLGATNS